MPTPGYAPVLPWLRLGWFQSGQPNSSMEPEDAKWAAEHPHGYGLVDAPNPFGYNRDIFDAQHPGYSGGYYNPATGFYNAPNEVPFSVAGPHGPETIGTGGLPFAPGEYHSSAASTAFAMPAQSWSMPMSSESDASMGNLPSGGDTTQPFDLGSFLDALSQFSEQRDSVQSDSNGS